MCVLSSIVGFHIVQLPVLSGLLHEEHDQAFDHLGASLCVRVCVRA